MVTATGAEVDVRAVGDKLLLAIDGEVFVLTADDARKVAALLTSHAGKVGKAVR